MENNEKQSILNPNKSRNDIKSVFKTVKLDMRQSFPIVYKRELYPFLRSENQNSDFSHFFWKKWKFKFTLSMLHTQCFRSPFFPDKNFPYIVIENSTFILHLLKERKFTIFLPFRREQTPHVLYTHCTPKSSS